MTTQEAITQKKPKHRSPSYPAIDLEAAIARARELYDKEKMLPAAIDVLFSHWGYAKGSSNGLVVLAALLKYGLLADEGSGDKRKARLTELARKIILDDRPNSREREAAIWEAALSPAIHREFWNQYKGSLPSDDNLRYELRYTKKFNELAVGTFIKELRTTWAFAKLSEYDSMSEEGADKLPPQKENEMAPPPQPSATAIQERPSNVVAQPAGQVTNSPKDVIGATLSKEHQRIPLRLVGGTEVTIELPSAMTNAAWEHMLKFLEVMKPGYVPHEEPKFTTTEPSRTEPTKF